MAKIDEMVEFCESKLNYYDIVDEMSETINYGLIIEFLADNFPISKLLGIETQKTKRECELNDENDGFFGF